MSTLIPLRNVNRSAKVGIGVKDLSSVKVTYVNLENKRQLRDLGRHTTLGQFIQVGAPRYQLDAGTIESGGIVTPRANSLTLDVSAAKYTSVDGLGTIGTAAAGTQAVTPDATNPLVAGIGLDTSTFTAGVPAILTATAAAAANTEARFLAAPATLAVASGFETTASRVWLALVWVPPTLGSVTGVAATGVFTKAAHGFKVGDPVWFNAVTGATAGLTTGTTYYVNTVPTTGTFTVSATLGGATLIWTTDVTAGSVQRQILAADIVDIRP